MKKGILALATGLGLLIGNPAHAKDKDFNKVVDSLRDCAYSSYKRQDHLTQENKSREETACLKLETLKREKGISSLEDYFKKNGPGKYGWLYANSKEITDGKQRDSHYAARITNKFTKEGFQVYFTRLGKGVDSFDGVKYNMKYLRTLNSPEGSKRIVIDLERIELDAIKVEKDWDNYLSNHKALIKGDLTNCLPQFESVYLSLKDSSNIKKAYFREKVNSILAHELEHATGNHRYDDLGGEKIARSAEVNSSVVGVYDIQKNASQGKPVEIEVLQCLMDTGDIFDMQKQADFYLRGKKYIQDRANYCKRQFIKQRQSP